MSDNWDDSDDEWDAGSDDDLDARLGLKKLSTNAPSRAAVPTFDDEEDLAVVDKQQNEKLQTSSLKSKGQALAEKKRKEKERQEELELAKKAMEMEQDIERNMTEEERRLYQKNRVEEADHQLTEDLFGGVDAVVKKDVNKVVVAADALVMKDLKDHLKQARKIGQCIKNHGKIHLCEAFLKECIEQCKDVLDDDSISDLIKTCNVIKNEKVQAAKRKVKGQAQKAKKDKAAEERAKKIHTETFGDIEKHYDEYDEYGDQYEDDFF